MKGAVNMSDHFDNNNNVFDGDVPQPENNNEFTSFPTGDNTEAENVSPDNAGDFSSGEYHFAYPKYANEDNDSPSAFAEPTDKTDETVADTEPMSPSFDNHSANNGFGASNPYSQSTTGYQGASANYNPNANGGPVGYTPYNWNNQNNNPNTGYNGNNGQPNNGYYHNPSQPQNNPYQTGGYQNAPVSTLR